MDKNDWQPKRRTELQFQHSLDNIGRSMLESIEGLTDPYEITKVITSWLNNFAFRTFANETARKIVTTISNSGAKTWREAARQNSNGRIIYEALRRELQGPFGVSVDFQIKRNAELIKSVPRDIANLMTKYISDESISGRRAEDIADDLIRKFPSITRQKAALIARTETSKTSTALTQARAEGIGLSSYVWRTSEDIRVRDSHRLMDGVIVFWRFPPSPERLDGLKNPPAPYHAGNIWNCRCYPEPIVDLDYLTWPCKVYWNGVITMMTRAQFEKLVM